ncbi:MAG: cobalamin-binding protein [Rhizobacter sp.]
MKRGWVLGALLGVAAWAHAASYVDDAGRTVDVPTVPQRVVTLAPNLTEFVYAVGAGDTLVGTMDTSNYPEAARRVPRIGDYQRLDVERIVSLKPDLVLVWYHGNQGREIEQLEAAGLRLFYLEPRRIDDVPRTLARMGLLLGHAAEGEARAATLRAELAALGRRHAAASPVSVFFQVWSQPLMTLNGDHLTSDVLAQCGGRNVFAALPALAPQVSLESVIAADPEDIFTTGDVPPAGPRWRRDTGREALAIWRSFPKLTAVRRGWMFIVPGDLVTRQGPRIVEGVKAVCEALDELRLERGRP